MTLSASSVSLATKLSRLWSSTLVECPGTLCHMQRQVWPKCQIWSHCLYYHHTFRFVTFCVEHPMCKNCDSWVAQGSMLILFWHALRRWTWRYAYLICKELLCCPAWTFGLCPNMCHMCRTCTLTLSWATSSRKRSSTTVRVWHILIALHLTGAFLSGGNSCRDMPGFSWARNCMQSCEVQNSTMLSVEQVCMYWKRFSVSYRSSRHWCNTTNVVNENPVT